MVFLEASANAGANRDENQSPEEMGPLCFPDDCDVEMSIDMLSQTAKVPSAIPTANWPARFHEVKTGSNARVDLLKGMMPLLYAIPLHI